MLAILSAACFIWLFLFLRAWPIVYGYWNSEGGGKAQQHSDYQFTVAVVTVVLNALTLGVLGFQAVIFREQARIANRQRKLTKGQIAISERQIELEEKQFLAEFRPRLIITNTWVSAQENSHPMINFGILNIGEMDARVGGISVRCEIYRVGKVSMAPPIAATGNIVVQHTLRPGMPIGTNYTFQDVPLTIAFHERDREDLTVISGTVIYFEINSSRPYHLGFSREMRGLSPVCTVSENSEREYSH
jgi:hypothetical protein